MTNVFQERVTRAQHLMREQKIDALLILNLEDYYYFSGDLRKQPRMLIPREGEPLLIVFANEKEEAERSTGLKRINTYRAVHEMMVGIIEFFNSLGVDRPRVGVAMDFSTPAFLLERFKMANPQVEVVDSKPVISPLRKVKGDEEIARIRRACQIADLGIKTALEAIGEGVREVDVATEAEYAMRKNGAERVAFPTFVNSGRHSLSIHGMATAKKIERGDLIVIDLGPVYQGYCGDICRTAVLGRAEERQRRLHSLYLALHRQTIENLKPGIKIFELEEKNQELADKAGYGEYYVRGFVHGVGLAFEETPFPTIFPEDIMEQVLPQMTLAVGQSILSVPGIGGVRVEDTALVTERGVELLTQFPRELLEVE